VASKWPFLDASFCPWCEKTIAPQLRRWRADAAEYACPGCGQRHTRKPGDPGIFVFYPGDIDLAVSHDVEPLFQD
jgi:hypothetical protein